MLKFAGTSQKPKFLNPPNLFKTKVGSGGIPAELIEKAEKLIQKSSHDFLPHAQTCLDKISKAIDDLAGNKISFEEASEDIIRPVMSLKAHAGMFGYTLMTNIADIALYFLEIVNEINDDTLDVLKAHENSLNAIVKNELKGTGGAEGTKLLNELEDACKRYFNKYPPPEIN